MISIDPGVYTVAVSGGVDSVVLLHMLNSHAKQLLETVHTSGIDGNGYLPQAPFTFIVAHLDHGMREDSRLDRKFVQELARQMGLSFIYNRVELGANASEEQARNARYDFLHKVKDATGSKAIITAHHQDDAIETAILNMLRGTGPRGLTSISNSGTVLRPLLKVPKSAIIQYAKDNQLVWREDPSNTDTKYARNYVRHTIVPKLSVNERHALIGYVDKLKDLNQDIEQEITAFLHVQPANNVLDRSGFIQLPHNVAREVIAQWLRHNRMSNYDKQLIERLVVAAKTLPPGRTVDVMNGRTMYVAYDYLALNT